MGACPTSSPSAAASTSYESEAMRGLGAAAGARRRRHRQHLRRHRRGRAPGAPGDPPRRAATTRRARIIVTGCAAQTEPAAFAAMPEVDRVLGNAEKLRAASLGRGLATSRAAPASVDDIMASARAGAAPCSTASTAARAPSCRCRTAATIAAPSASSPIGRGNSRCVAGRRRRRRRCARLVEAGYARGRADRRRPHELRRRPAGPPAPRHPRPAHPARGARPAAPAPLLDRLGRGRSPTSSAPSPRRSG